MRVSLNLITTYEVGVLIILPVTEQKSRLGDVSDLPKNTQPEPLGICTPASAALNHCL